VAKIAFIRGTRDRCRRTLLLIPNFFGADETITNYVPATDQWAAMLIFKAYEIAEAYERLRETFTAICRMDCHFKTLIQMK
jgi:hypothetical protein